MSDVDLVRDMNYHRRMAAQDALAAQNYVREARKAADAGDTKHAQLQDANASACERRAALWTQLAGEIDAYLSERAVSEPRLL